MQALFIVNIDQSFRLLLIDDLVILLDASNAIDDLVMFTDA